MFEERESTDPGEGPVLAGRRPRKGSWECQRRGRRRRDPRHARTISEEKNEAMERGQITGLSSPRQKGGRDGGGVPERAQEVGLRGRIHRL